MTTTQDKLNELLTAYSKHSKSIEDELYPGLSIDEIKNQTNWFPYDVPEAIYDLYSWKSGQKIQTETPFMFRDMQIIDLNTAKTNYECFVKSYGQDNDWIVDVKRCFPFAECEGAHLTICSDGKFPIVSIFEGVDIFFNSFESMLDTCIEWVNQDNFEYFDEIPNEHSIWKKHNPGLEIFAN